MNYVVVAAIIGGFALLWHRKQISARREQAALERLAARHHGERLGYAATIAWLEHHTPEPFDVQRHSHRRPLGATGFAAQFALTSVREGALRCGDARNALAPWTGAVS